MKNVEITVDITKEADRIATERIAVIKGSIIELMAEYDKRIDLSPTSLQASKWANIAHGLERAVRIIDIEVGIEKLPKE